MSLFDRPIDYDVLEECSCSSDETHCECWWEGEPCCRCRAPGYQRWRLWADRLKCWWSELCGR